MTHFLHDWFYRSLFLLPFLGLGMATELAVRSQARFGLQRVGWNMLVTAIYVGVDVWLALTWAPPIVHWTRSLPGAGLLSPMFSGQSSVAVVVLGAFLWIGARDFFYYWWHRAQHAVPWLWKVHAVHHSDEQMNVTTTHRLHWLESPMRLVLVTAPIGYFWTPALSLVIAVWLLDTALGYWVHLDVPLGFRGWNRIIPSPQNHRVHHSALAVHRDRNFSFSFPVWDVVFGTYYAAQPAEYPPTGLIATTREPDSAPVLRPSTASV